MRFTTDEIAAATSGQAFGLPAMVDGASIDSRLVGPGELFVPIIADRNGHDFIASALGAGAGAYLSSEGGGDGSGVLVEDTQVALSDLGNAARARMGERVIAITGSVGKTSLKDMLSAVTAATFRTTASVGSFNNELGVPLTLINAPDDTQCAVVEMGARGAGHISDLCDIARPNVGVVTVVAAVHTQVFGSIDEVAKGKGELIASLPESGTAVLNADDPRVLAMTDLASCQVLTFGQSGGDVRASSVELDDNLHSSFLLETPWGAGQVRLPVAGRHQVVNALGAAAAALAVGVPVEAVCDGLGGASLSAMRMDLVTTSTGLRVLNDTYNANPTSMAAALRSIAELPAARRFAVLGTMAELGDDEAPLHRDIAVLAQELGIELLSLNQPWYGVEVDDLVESPSRAIDRLKEFGVGDGDVVLVKASRSAGLEKVVELLFTQC